MGHNETVLCSVVTRSVLCSMLCFILSCSITVVATCFVLYSYAVFCVYVLFSVVTCCYLLQHALNICFNMPCSHRWPRLLKQQTLITVYPSPTKFSMSEVCRFHFPFAAHTRKFPFSVSSIFLMYIYTEKEL
jgi:hypothetical protein